MVNIAFTGGGTGGHIYPGLAVAAEIRRRFGGTGCRIFWIGSDRGRDRALVEAAGLDFFGVPAGKLRRYFSLKTIPDSFRVAAGFFAALAVLQRQKPDLLFSKGGFVSVPPCAAAALLGIPVFTHESDYSPGLATRLNLRFARRTGGMCFISYGETARFLPAAFSERTVVSGNPVRAVFRAASPEQGRAFLGLGPAARILLVLGGSQGASELNALVRSALPELCRRYTVVHQTGDRNWDVPASDCYLHYPYLYDEMPHVLAAAELVLGRAGAGTVWESAALGKPMALLPLRGSGTRGDQVENARFFENAGAAVTLAETDANPETLAAVINGLADDAVRRNSMAAASRKTGERDGAAVIGGFIGDFIKKNIPESGEAQ